MTLKEIMERTYGTRSGQPGFKQVTQSYKAALRFMEGELEKLGKTEKDLMEFNDWEWTQYMLKLNVHSSAGLYKKCYNMLLEWYEENGKPGGGFPLKSGLGYLRNRELEFRGQAKRARGVSYKRDPNFVELSDDIQAELNSGSVVKGADKNGTARKDYEGFSFVDNLNQFADRRRADLAKSNESDGLDRENEYSDREVGDSVCTSGGEREEPESGRSESGGSSDVASDREVDEYSGDPGDHEND